MKKICALLFCLVGCGNLPSANFHSALYSQPYVVSVTPPPEASLSQLQEIEITFSAPIHKDSIRPSSLSIIEGEIKTDPHFNLEQMIEDLEKNKMNSLEGQFEVDSKNPKIRWTSNKPIYEGSYTLVITPHLESTDHIPFNQTPGQDPSPFFVTFRLTQNTATSRSPNSSANPSDKRTKVLTRPSSFVINELLYDAVGSDTDGNEFIELYGTPETDIEGYQLVIVNGSDGEILKTIPFPTDSKIPSSGIFLVADSKTNQSGVSNILGADFIDNFDPQNGPDAIQLLDNQGNLLDAVAYGTGNIPLAQNGLPTGEGNPTPDVAAGHSLSRTQGQDTNDNAVDFIDLSVPTPGVL